MKFIEECVVIRLQTTLSMVSTIVGNKLIGLYFSALSAFPPLCFEIQLMFETFCEICKSVLSVLILEILSLTPDPFFVFGQSFKCIAGKSENRAKIVKVENEEFVWLRYVFGEFKFLSDTLLMLLGL